MQLRTLAQESWCEIGVAKSVQRALQPLYVIRIRLGNALCCNGYAGLARTEGLPGWFVQMIVGSAVTEPSLTAREEAAHAAVWRNARFPDNLRLIVSPRPPVTARQFSLGARRQPVIAVLSTCPARVPVRSFEPFVRAMGPPMAGSPDAGYGWADTLRRNDPASQCTVTICRTCDIPFGPGGADPSNATSQGRVPIDRSQSVANSSGAITPPTDLDQQTCDTVAPSTDRQVMRTDMMTTPDSVSSAGSADLTVIDSGPVTAESEASIDKVVDAGGPVEPINNEAAKTLWDALIQARSQSPVISAAEDAVFRFYLPLARATARTYAGWTVDPDLAEQAAELGLANAVLAWRRADICAFAAFARAAMIRQMSVTANARARRLRPAIPARAHLSP